MPYPLQPRLTRGKTHLCVAYRQFGTEYAQQLVLSPGIALAWLGLLFVGYDSRRPKASRTMAGYVYKTVNWCKQLFINCCRCDSHFMVWLQRLGRPQSITTQDHFDAARQQGCELKLFKYVSATICGGGLLITLVRLGVVKLWEEQLLQDFEFSSTTVVRSTMGLFTFISLTCAYSRYYCFFPADFLTPLHNQARTAMLTALFSVLLAIAAAEHPWLFYSALFISYLFALIFSHNAQSMLQEHSGTLASNDSQEQTSDLIEARFAGDKHRVVEALLNSWTVANLSVAVVSLLAACIWVYVPFDGSTQGRREALFEILLLAAIFIALISRGYIRDSHNDDDILLAIHSLWDNE